MPELVCPKHGPYDSSYGTCPHCQAEAGGRPVAPAPLDEDDLPTELGPPGAGAPPGGMGEDDLPTELGPRRGRSGGYVDLEDEELTSLGRMAHDDVTELDFAQVKTGPLAILWVKEGPYRGRIYKVQDGSTVGRSDGDVILDDPKVSNPHAKFTLNEDDQFLVWDFGSRNGTFINGDRIMAATPLSENDEIKMGDLVFAFKVLE
jgi:hypothetical protein